MTESSSAFSGLIDMITDPAKAMRAADNHPKRMWLPFILSIVLPCIFVAYYFSVVDMEWMFQQTQAQAIANGGEMPDEARAFMTSGIMMGSALAGTVIVVSIMTAISAVYFLMVSKFTTEDTRGFGAWFSMSAWAGVPGILAALLMIIYFAVAGNSQMGMEDVTFFSLNSLAMHYPSGSPQAGFYNAITPFMLWSLFLLAVGLKTWTGRTMGKSLMIAAAPYVVMFGIYGAMVL